MRAKDGEAPNGGQERKKRGRPRSGLEAKTERVAIAVTPSEKGAIRGLAETRGTTESEVLRETLIRDALAEWQRVSRKAA